MIITLRASRGTAKAIPVSVGQEAVISDWRVQPASDLMESENLLDSLEASGFQDCELVVLDDGGFAVRWR
jgi:hypothetical protein